MKSIANKKMNRPLVASIPPISATSLGSFLIKKFLFLVYFVWVCCIKHLF